jgi:nitrogen fixation/metabolism regulation signal transduction histidine kinase
VVKKIADEHAARIEISNLLEEGDIQGAQVSLSFAVVQEAQGLNLPTS